MSGYKDSKYVTDSKNNKIVPKSSSWLASSSSSKVSPSKTTNIERSSLTSTSSSFSSTAKYESSITKKETTKSPSIWNPSSSLSTNSFSSSSKHTQSSISSTSTSSSASTVYKSNPFSAMTNHGNENGISSINKNAIDAVAYTTTHYKSPFLPSSSVLNSRNRLMEGSKYLQPTSGNYKSPIVNRSYSESEKLFFDPKSNLLQYKGSTSTTSPNNMATAGALSAATSITTSARPSASSYNLPTNRDPVKLATVTSPKTITKNPT